MLFWPTFHIFVVTGEKLHISLTYMYFAHPIDFFALPILKKKIIYQIWFLFVRFLVLILIHAILEQPIDKKMVNRI